MPKSPEMPCPPRDKFPCRALRASTQPMPARYERYHQYTQYKQPPSLLSSNKIRYPYFEYTNYTGLHQPQFVNTLSDSTCPKNSISKANKHKMRHHNTTTTKPFSIACKPSERKSDLRHFPPQSRSYSSDDDFKKRDKNQNATDSPFHVSLKRKDAFLNFNLTRKQWIVTAFSFLVPAGSTLLVTCLGLPATTAVLLHLAPSRLFFGLFLATVIVVTGMVTLGIGAAFIADKRPDGALSPIKNNNNDQNNIGGQHKVQDENRASLKRQFIDSKRSNQPIIRQQAQPLADYLNNNSHEDDCGAPLFQVNI